MISKAKKSWIQVALARKRNSDQCRPATINIPLDLHAAAVEHFNDKAAVGRWLHQEAMKLGENLPEGCSSRAGALRAALARHIGWDGPFEYQLVREWR